MDTPVQIQPGMTPEQMQQTLAAAFKQSIDNSNSILKSQSDLINARRNKLFGMGNSNLTDEQANKLSLLTQLIEKNPIIIDPLIGYGAVLVKANAENMAAMQANPTVIIDFNKWLHDQGIIKDPPPAQTQGQST